MFNKSLALAISGLLLGTAFLGTANAAQPTAGQKFGDWSIGCDQDGGQSVCHLDQAVIDNNTQKPVLQVGVGYLPGQDGKKQPKMVIIVPLGVILPQGLTVQIDDGPGAQVPFLHCMAAGCRTVVNLDAPTIAKFKAGTKAKMTFAAPNGQPVSVPVSLSGFTAGFDALKP